MSRYSLSWRVHYVIEPSGDSKGLCLYYELVAICVFLLLNLKYGWSLEE